jgi:ATP-binding cassette, subfamily B, multidrug efflux pump
MARLTRFLRPYRALIVLVLVLTFLQTMLNLYLPNLMANIVDNGVVKGDTRYIVLTGAWMLAVTCLGGVASVVSRYYGARISAFFGRDLRAHLFRHVEHFTLKEFDTFGNSSLIVRTTNDVWQVQQLTFMLQIMVTAPLTGIGGIILAMHEDLSLSWIILIVLPMMAAVIYSVMRPSIRLFGSIQRRLDRLNLVLRENLTGVRVIRSFDRMPYETKRFDTANRELTDTQVQVYQLLAFLWPAVMLIMNLSTVAVVWFGAPQINTGAFQIGQLLAFVQYLTQIMMAVLMMSMMIFQLPRALASAERIREVLETEPEITDAPTASQAPAALGRVEFRNVTFHYPGAEEAALSNVSFATEPGTVTAVIGGTGSGKSTLVNLIMRFYDVTEGSILVDGVDVRDMTQAELRRRIGYVPQRAVLFSGSVLENLRFGDLEATEEAARAAAAVAQASEFIDALPDGLEAQLNQGGRNFSGGQRQRLSIARALVRKASLYLLDDCFSALDFATDARLRAALRRRLDGASLLIVAQRVGTVMDADRILVLDEGRLVGAGRHQELVATCPVYREIVESQLRPEGIA